MDQNTPPEKLDKIIHVDCNSCGSEMVFSPEKQSLLCSHCGNSKALPRASDMVLESSFSEAMNLTDLATGYGTETKIFHCNTCGAETAVDDDAVSFSCPFCDSSNVNEEAQHAKVIQPSGIMPFKVTKKAAMAKFGEWIKKGFFAPGKLKSLARLDRIRGVYVPFWTYDAETSSSWSADAGYYYYVSENSTDSSGETVTKQVKKTRWVPASGYYEHCFDDVLVVGSKGLLKKSKKWTSDYDLSEVLNYDPRYILGLESEVYQVDVKEGFKLAEKIMDREIESEIEKQIPGDTHRFLKVNTNKHNITFKHVLLPVWVAGYSFKEKVYQFIVNGQTGKASGNKPVSAGKVIALVVTILGVIGTALYFLLK